MCTVVPVMLRYVYCCTCNVEICILLSTVETDFYEGGGQEGVRQMPTTSNKYILAKNLLGENTFMSCG